MAQFSDKIPPPFDRKVDIYSKWKKSFIIWQSITDVANTKQGGLLVLRLDEDTREEVLELVRTDDLKTEGGVKKVTDQLDKIFQKDETATAYEAYEDFDTYQRSANTSITEYCREFQRRLKKVEDGGTKLADHILAYRLIKSAHLSESQGQLLKATTTAMTYAEVTKQLKKIFKSDDKEVYKNDVSPTIKDEPVETHYGGPYRRFDRNNSSQSRNDYKGQVDQQGGYRPESNRWSKDQPESNKWSKDQGGTVNKKGYKKRGKNPLDQYGRVTRCLNCDSINHWIRDCPDLSKQEQKTYLEQCDKDADDGEEKDSQEGPVFVIDHAALLTDELKDPTKVTLSCNTMSSAVLDCGAPKNVCGRVWLQQYIETLSDSDITAGQRKTRGVTFEDSVEDGHTELSVNNAHEPPQPEAIGGLNSVVIEIPADEETEVRVVVDESATEDNTAEQLVRENEVLSDDNAAVEEERIATDIDIHQAQGEVEELTDGDEVDQENSSSETSGSSTDDNNIDHDGIGTVSVKRGPGRPRKNKIKSSDDGDSDRKARLRTGVKVRFKAGDNEAWTSATLGRRAGKKNGVHKHCWNTTDSSGENTDQIASTEYVSLQIASTDKDVDEWELLHDTANREVTETYLTQSYINKASEETQIAKQTELDSWRNNEVYTEVENTGKEYVTGKWVIKPLHFWWWLSLNKYS